MAETYFVILGGKDGDIYIRQMTQKELLDGMKPYNDPKEPGMQAFGDCKILDKLPTDLYNFSDMVIIKGHVVVPKPKQVIMEYTLD
jgi:hypothetical protein